MPKFKRDVCEVCSEPVIDISKLPAEIREKVYKPEPDETYNVEVDLTPPRSFQGTSPVEIDVGTEIESDTQ